MQAQEICGLCSDVRIRVVGQAHEGGKGLRMLKRHVVQRIEYNSPVRNRPVGGGRNQRGCAFGVYAGQGICRINTCDLIRGPQPPL